SSLHLLSHLRPPLFPYTTLFRSSPGDLAPVFEAMVERAAHLCEADEAALRTFDGEVLHLVAAHGSEPQVMEQLHKLGPTRLIGLDRKSTRLNSSHLGISYAVFCL